MARMIGYMITWTTYGSWLQGDERGYVKGSRILKGNMALETSNIANLKTAAVELDPQQRQIVRDAILKKAEALGQEIYALAVCTNHIHIVSERVSESIEMVVSGYKNAARLSLQANGFVGRVWTRGFDKRFCFTQQEMENRIKYVLAHDERNG
jgi:REP element-mobilizing transposase RayT